MIKHSNSGRLFTYKILLEIYKSIKSIMKFEWKAVLLKDWIQIKLGQRKMHTTSILRTIQIDRKIDSWIDR